MNATQGDKAGEDVICVLWVSTISESRDRNKQMMQNTSNSQRSVVKLQREKYLKC